MKPFFNAQMKAWNQQAAAGDLAPEARQTIAHGETVGKMRDGFKPRMGRKKNLHHRPDLPPLPGLCRFGERTHGCAVGYFLPRLRR
jgi:hypothetical protein